MGYIVYNDVFSGTEYVDADFTFVAALDASGIVSGFDGVYFANLNNQNWGFFWLIWSTGAVDCDSIEFELKIEGVGTDGVVFAPYIENPAADANFYFGKMQFQDSQSSAIYEGNVELIYTAIDGKFKVRCLGLPTITFDRIKCELAYINSL